MVMVSLLLISLFIVGCLISFSLLLIGLLIVGCLISFRKMFAYLAYRIGSLESFYVDINAYY